MNEQLKAFWEAVQADTVLQQKLSQTGGDVDAIAEIAKELGFSITSEAIEEAISDLELSEEQLSNVAGSWVTITPAGPSGGGSGGCITSGGASPKKKKPKKKPTTEPKNPPTGCGLCHVVP